MVGNRGKTRGVVVMEWFGSLLVLQINEKELGSGFEIQICKFVSRLTPAPS